MLRPTLPAASHGTGLTPTLNTVLKEFTEHLIRSGLSQRYACRLTVQAERCLTWLKNNDLEIEAINYSTLQRYHNHATCRRGLASACFKLIGFLEDTGRIVQLKWMTDGIYLLDKFFEQYTAQNYALNTIKVYRGSCLHFVYWLHQSRISIRELNKQAVVDFIRHDCVCANSGFQCSTNMKNKRQLLEKFAKYLLTQSGGDSVVFESEKNCMEELMTFGDWLHQSRGISSQTIDCHKKMIAEILPHLGDDPNKYDAACIKSVALRCFEELPRSCAKKGMSSLRMYLRFLASNEKCAPNIVDAVPSFPRWRQSALPRYIAPDDVERVIESCDMNTLSGQRNKAILLLLARLGLRAGDIVNLKLSDIDWKQARVHVCGKSKRYVGLPLPQDVGDALLNYIMHVRPQIKGEQTVFLLVVAPYRPFSNLSAITGIVNKALTCSGVKHAGKGGARLLRHSAATNLLRGGSSLEVVGTLLRHRSPDTTAIYAKVNVPMLNQVAEPWIGGV